MSTDSLNGVVGEVARFAGDYLFRERALPNNTTINSEEHTLNNTLGRLQLTGEINRNLTLSGTNSLTVTLQWLDGTEWRNLATVFSASGVATIPAGRLFIPVPSNTRRIHRLQVTTNFNAVEVGLTAAVELLPLS